ncbi:hypothetical protein BGW36DRAFT_365727 [Talaromyces proteolyticus]|uniref:Uncharacterized protein n=1 Tax=Talaromyces proteolyticus TaxID=1131652 RepID=A0AAD4PUD1_9EURO|nr:uncharacterized protein BGW36DRAFT_365727 [Talaromyces proteolyticus]KAH8689195.1 hypothetical protein BGW36DRAFT_365727 [Talaromyces proteolyticus]
MENGQVVPGSIYVYAPNKIAPIVFTVLYALSACSHLWQCWRFKAWNIIGLHPFCAVLFTVGYALREVGAFNYYQTSQTLIIYIMSQVFIYVGPPLLELANYHVLGRIFHYIPFLAPLAPSRVLGIFGAATMMLVNSLLWNVWNPGRYLPSSSLVSLAEDGQTEMITEELDDEPRCQGRPYAGADRCLEFCRPLLGKERAGKAEQDCAGR